MKLKIFILAALVFFSLVGTMVFAASPVTNTTRIVSNFTYLDNKILGYCNATDSDTVSISYELNWYKNGILSSSVTDICYQESANVSTTCGGLSSGIYASNLGDYYQGSYAENNFIDGNWNTNYTVPCSGGAKFCTADLHITEVYINYSKPTNSLDTSLWQIKGGEPSISTNLSIPLSCWNYNINTLSLKVDANSNNVTFWQCYNSTSWRTIINTTGIANGNILFEDAMLWRINTSQTQGVEINVANKSDTYSNLMGNWTLSCRAFDNSTYSSWLNSSVLYVNDSILPFWNTNITNATSTTPQRSHVIQLNTTLTDEVGLSYYVLAHNLSGVMINQSFKVVPSSPFVMVENLSVNISRGSIAWQVWFNDSSGNWANTSVFSTQVIPVSCQNLSMKNMVYSLDSDVKTASTCFEIRENNITLNCNGYNIIGSLTSDKYGIDLLNSYNTTIKNCIITNFSTAIWENHSPTAINTSHIFNNNSLIKNSGQYSGIYLGYSNGNVINNTNIINNSVSTTISNAGIYLFNSNYNMIQNTLIETCSAHTDFLNSGFFGLSSTIGNSVINLTLNNNNASATTIHGGLDFGFYGSSDINYLSDLVFNNIHNHNSTANSIFLLSEVYGQNTIENFSINNGRVLYQQNGTTISELTIKSYNISDGNSDVFLLNGTVSSLKVSKPMFGLLEFTKPIIQTEINLSSNIIIKNASIYIDSNNYPNLNKSANITFYNTSSLGLKNPGVMKNGVFCSDCWVYNIGDTFKFNVTSFSNYTLADISPQVTDVAVVPSPASSLSNLTCNFTITTFNSSTNNLSSAIRWYNNSIFSGIIINNVTNVNSGERWLCQITPIDNNSVSGFPVNSSSVLIGDITPPVINFSSTNNVIVSVQTQIYVNTTDSGIIDYVYVEVDDPDGIKTNYTMDLYQGTNTGGSNKWNKNITPTKTGVWRVKFYASDGSGNSGNTSESFDNFIVSSAPIPPSSGGGGSPLRVLSVSNLTEVTPNDIIVRTSAGASSIKEFLIINKRVDDSVVDITLNKEKSDDTAESWVTFQSSVGKTLEVNDLLLPAYSESGGQSYVRYNIDIPNNVKNGEYDLYYNIVDAEGQISELLIQIMVSDNVLFSYFNDLWTMKVFGLSMMPLFILVGLSVLIIFLVKFGKKIFNKGNTNKQMRGVDYK